MKRKDTRQLFAEKAVKLYKQGKPVVDIAVALGYKRGSGQNRVRGALMKAGVYKTSTNTAKAKPEAAGTNSKVVAMPVPTGAEMALRECYKFVQDRYSKLVGRQRTGFIERLNGMLLAGTGATAAQKVAPVELPQDLHALRKASA